jgi:hypothetical protein
MGFQAGNVQTPSGEIPGGSSVSSNKGIELSKQEIEFLSIFISILLARKRSGQALPVTNHNKIEICQVGKKSFYQGRMPP